MKNKKAQKLFESYLQQAGKFIDKKDFNYDNVISNSTDNPDLQAIIAKDESGVLKKYLEVLQKTNLIKENKP